MTFSHMCRVISQLYCLLIDFRTLAGHFCMYYYDINN